MSIIRTEINKEEQITFCESPIHLRLSNDAGDTSIVSAIVYLWIWNGDQNKALSNPNHTLKKVKVSAADNYINIEISYLIKSYLENPLNAPNTSQPNFYYNEAGAPAITGQGVFWQIQTEITSAAGAVIKDYETNFATLGYRWNYEQNAGTGNNGLTPNGSLGFEAVADRWYNSQIHNYISQSFNLTNSIEGATTENMINIISVTPPAGFIRQARDASLIVFLNKVGLWDMFTPNGKIVASSKMEFETSERAFRDPSNIDNSYTHSKRRGDITVTQKYIINTGSLNESMAALFEELVYSHKVYLILFKGDLQTEEQLGITVDSTIITADNINVTVDSATVGAEDLGFFKTHRQIPVIITDSDFLRKNRVNDKNEINYSVSLEETNNKINNIR